MSRAQQVNDALVERLGAIDTINGYATTVGLNVYRGRIGIDVDLIPCITLVELAETSRPKEGRQTAEHLSTVRYVAEGHAECDPDNPAIVGHLLVADIKRALWGPKDPTLGGVARALRFTGRMIEPRAEGAGNVIVSIEFEVDFFEDLASP